MLCQLNANIYIYTRGKRLALSFLSIFNMFFCGGLKLLMLLQFEARNISLEEIKNTFLYELVFPFYVQLYYFPFAVLFAVDNSHFIFYDLPRQF